MNDAPEWFALRQNLEVCLIHRDTLRDALDDLEQRALGAADLDALTKADRRLLDQFAYRYTRLQDDLGARLMPAVLRALQEDIGPLSVRDRLDRLEQLGWLASAEDWNELRRIRNEFAHDYPATAAERLQRLMAAQRAAEALLIVLARFVERIANQFPDLPHPDSG
jgi:hypothetical protein